MSYDYIEEDIEVREAALQSVNVERDVGQDVPIWKRLLSNPTTVWASLWYLFVQITVFSIHFIRNAEGGILATHEYFMEILFHFGLNAPIENDPFYLSGFVAFLLLPFFILTLGSALFFIPSAGFSVDGKLPEETVSSTFRYFDPSQFVYGSDVYLFGLDNLGTLPFFNNERIIFFSNHYLILKMNMFFVPLLIAPLFFSAIITLYYMNRTKKKSLLLDKVLILFVLSAITGIIYASFSGTVDFDIFVQEAGSTFSDNLRIWDWAIIQNLFQRDRNLIVDYDGQYHPMSNWISFWVCSFAWVAMFNLAGTVAHRDYSNVIGETPKRIVDIGKQARYSSIFTKTGVVLCITFIGLTTLFTVFLGVLVAFSFYLSLQIFSFLAFLLFLLYNTYSNREYRAQAPFVSSLREFSAKNSDIVNSTFFWVFVLFFPLVWCLLFLMSKLNDRYSWFNPTLLREEEETDLPW